MNCDGEQRIGRCLDGVTMIVLYDDEQRIGRCLDGVTVIVLYDDEQS